MPSANGMNMEATATTASIQQYHMLGMISTVEIATPYAAVSEDAESSCAP